MTKANKLKDSNVSVYEEEVVEVNASLVEKYQGLKKGDIIEALIVKESMGFNDALKYYAKHFAGAQKRSGFRANFYAFLQEGPKTEGEAKSFIEDNGSKNDAKNVGHYLAIYELAEFVRTN